MGAILVTGAAGFIGSHVCEHLLTRGEQVVGIDNFDPYYDPQIKRRNLAELQSSDDFRFFELDIRDKAGLTNLAEATEIERIVHIAALAGVRASIDRAADYVDVNINGTVNILELARGIGSLHTVLASTSSVYGATEKIPFVETDVADRPLAPYPATKRAVELIGHAYHNLHGLPITALRFFSVYGPRGRPDMMPYKLSNSLLFGEEVLLFENGEMYRDWTYIDDIARGILGALDHPNGYEIYNLGRGESVSMAYFVNYLEEISGRRANVRAVPAPPSEPPTTYADIRKAQADFDYAPEVSVEEGLERFWKWRTAQPDAPKGSATQDMLDRLA